MFASTFQNEENEFKKRKSLIAAFSTAFLHGAILLILFYTLLRTPIPPFEDNAGGMAINFGTDDAGTGDEQPFTYNPGPTEAVAAKPAATQPIASAPEELLTQDKEESEVVAPKVEKKKPAPKVNENAVFKKNPTPVVSTKPVAAAKPVEAPPAPKADPNALFSKGAYGKPNNSKGDGTGGGQGDQGKPDGDPNSRNYLGDKGDGNSPGSGGMGSGFSLHGRSRISLPPPQQCNTQGKVVVQIKVDKNGKVVDAVFKRFESTTFDDCNVTNALNAARRATFNADDRAPDFQTGTITYIYKVH